MEWDMVPMIKMSTKHLIICSPSYVPEKLSILLDNNNFKNLSTGTYHTSLGDISVDNLIVVSKEFDTIEFINDRGYTPETHLQTNTVLNYISSFRTIQNFIPDTPTTFLNKSVVTNTTPALWVFGCSFSNGVGVLSSEKYSSIVSNHLNLPLMDITQSGSSTRWSLRHLLQANISTNDIVIWQLTTFGRFSSAENKTTLTEFLLKNAQREVVVNSNDLQLYVDQLSLLSYGVQYLRAKKVKFKIISLESPGKFCNDLINEYIRYPEYCYLPNWQIDTGSDNIHPGKLSHKLVAENILNSL